MSLPDVGPWRIWSRSGSRRPWTQRSAVFSTSRTTTIRMCFSRPAMRTSAESTMPGRRSERSCDCSRTFRWPAVRQLFAAANDDFVERVVAGLRKAGLEE